jgi:hypothetical protein
MFKLKPNAVHTHRDGLTVYSLLCQYTQTLSILVTNDTAELQFLEKVTNKQVISSTPPSTPCG